MKKAEIPNRKVTAGAGSGAAVVILVWALGQFGVVMPPEIAAALTTIVSLFAGYFTPENLKEVLDTVTDKAE